MELSVLRIGLSLMFFWCCGLAAQNRVISTCVNNDEKLTDASEEEILTRIFGARRKYPKNTLMEFTVLLDGEKIGEIMVLLNRSQKKAFAKHLKEVLSTYLTASEIKKIDAITDKNGFADIESISFSNMKAKFNSLTLQLEVTVNIGIKKTRSLGKNTLHRDIPNVTPAFFSGFINARLSQVNQHGGATGSSATTLLLTPVFNVGGVVMEGEFSYNSAFRRSNSQSDEGGGKYLREYTSLVYDLPDHDMRLLLGDVFSNSIEYQNVPRVIGFGFKKFAPINHLDNHNRSIRIILLRRSTLEVYVNDTLVQTKKDIAPGTYTLDDIPYSHGSNNIKIKLIDDTGRRRELDSSLFLDSAILEQGESNYGITIGYPEINHGRRYDKNLLFSGFFRYGLLDSLECSAGIQGNNTGTSYTIGLKQALDFGIFDFRYAKSHNKSTDRLTKMNGSAFYADYSSPVMDIFGINISAGVSFERLDSFFFPYLANADSIPAPSALANQNQQLINSELVNNMIAMRGDTNLDGKNSNIRYHLCLSNIFGTTWNCNYYIKNRFNQPKEKTLSITASKFISFEDSMFQHGYINASFNSVRSRDYKNINFSLSCSLTIRDSCTISAGYYDADAKYGHFSISKYSDDNGFGYDLSYSGTKKSHGYGTSLLYNHPRFKADIHHYGHSGGNNNTNSIQMGFESTLFFADSAFSVARNNIYDGGFVIVEPENELKNTNLRFNNSRSESGMLGGAVLTTNRKQTNISRLDLKNFPANMEVKKDTIISEGLYKRGGYIKISSEGCYMARGMLLNDSGEPMALVNGYAIHTTNKNANPVQFFTNTSGKFVINGLNKGKYKVTINVEDCEDFEIEIPDNEKSSCKKTIKRSGNVFDIGAITIKGNEEKGKNI
jgi:outer membrane usher protein